jgi:hypothetical protein
LFVRISSESRLQAAGLNAEIGENAERNSILVSAFSAISALKLLTRIDDYNPDLKR